MILFFIQYKFLFSLMTKQNNNASLDIIFQKCNILQFDVSLEDFRLLACCPKILFNVTCKTKPETDIIEIDYNSDEIIISINS